MYLKGMANETNPIHYFNGQTFGTRCGLTEAQSESATTTTDRNSVTCIRCRKAAGIATN